MDDVEYKTYPHTPPHLFHPNSKYFITCAIYQKKPFLRDSKAKAILLDSIRKGCAKYGWTLDDWVILDNHYHAMLSAPEKASTLSLMMKDIHRFASMRIRKALPEIQTKQKMFHNYWDTCISYETSYFARLNYIYLNPIKHRMAEHPKDYPWCSYKERFAEDEENVIQLGKKFPCDKVHVEDDF